MYRVWTHLWLSQLGRGCYRHIGGGHQGCCSTAYSALDGPPQRTVDVNSAEGEKPALGAESLGWIAALPLARFGMVGNSPNLSVPQPLHL